MAECTVDLLLPCCKPRPGWMAKVLPHLSILADECSARGFQLNVHLIDDGSGPGYFPEEELEQLRRSVPHFHFYSFPHNHGKGYALRHGVRSAQGEYQIYTDYDFPFGATCVLTALEHLRSGYDVVMGIREESYNDALPSLRRVMSNSLKRLNSVCLGLPSDLCDTQAGLKGFNAAGKRAFLATKVNQFLFDAEFILLAHQNNLRIARIPLRLRDGIHMSRMGLRIIRKETGNLISIVLHHRIQPRPGRRQKP